MKNFINITNLLKFPNLLEKNEGGKALKDIHRENKNKLSLFYGNEQPEKRIQMEKALQNAANDIIYLNFNEEYINKMQEQYLNTKEKYISNTLKFVKEKFVGDVKKDFTNTEFKFMYNQMNKDVYLEEDIKNMIKSETSNLFLLDPDLLIPFFYGLNKSQDRLII